MNISDSKSNFSAQFLLIEFHFDDFEWKPFMEQSVDLGTAAELHSVDLS